MTPDSTTALLLAIAALGSGIALLLKARTALFGFALLNALLIGATGLLAFILTRLFGLSDDWIRDAHITVFTYTAYGVIAIVLGTVIAWRPLIRRQRRGMAKGLEAALAHAPWVNPRFALFCVSIGVMASVLEPFIFQIPTIGAIWHHLTGFLRVGVVIALVDSMRTGRRTLFFQSLAALILVGLLSALSSGHIGVLWMGTLQLGLIGSLGLSTRMRRIVFTSLLLIPVLALYVGWLQTRGLIREGHLREHGTTDAAVVFVDSLLSASNPLALNATLVRDAVLDRVDASDLLAAQVEYQPEREPYARGGTIASGLAAALIPRFLWPEKPFRAGGSEFVTKFTGIVFGSRTSVGLPYPFELYANGGPYLVIAGLFFIGWVLARLELALFVPHESLSRLLSMLLALVILGSGGERVHLMLMSLATGLAATYGLGKLVESLFPEYSRALLGQWRQSRQPGREIPPAVPPRSPTIGAVGITRGAAQRPASP